MGLSPELRKSFRIQKDKDFRTWIRTIYPFSFRRTILIVFASIFIALLAVWLTYSLLNTVMLPENTAMERFGPVLGPVITRPGIKALLGFFSIGPLQALAFFIIFILCGRIKRTMYINVFREAIQLVDNLPPFPFRKKYLMMQDIEDAAVKKDDAGHWIVVTMAGGAQVCLLVRTVFWDDGEQAQNILEAILNHKKRWDQMKKSGDGPAWKKRLADFVNPDEFNENMDDEEKFPLLEAILKEIAAGNENPKILRKESPDRVELRMNRKGIPLRVAIDDYGQTEIEVKPGLKKGSFYLNYDEEKIPKERDPGDPWSDEDELIVFVAKGVYATEEDMGSVEETLSTLEALPPQMTADLLAEMETQKSRFCHLQADFDSMEANMLSICYLNDPVKDIRDAVDFVTDIASHIGSNALKLPKGGPKSFEFTRCGYCGSRYTLGLRQQCPNCGSPPN